MKPAIVLHAPQIPETRLEVREIFGDPRPRTNDKGNLVATNLDFKKRIVRVEFPIGGKLVKRWVHKLLSDTIMDAIKEVNFYDDLDTNLLSDTNPIKAIGTYCIRYIRGSSTKLLSLHSFGIAVDINATENRMGKPGKLTAGSLITYAFERRGFVWGGHWRGKSCDPMHFEYFDRRKK